MNNHIEIHVSLCSVLKIIYEIIYDIYQTEHLQSTIRGVLFLITIGIHAQENLHLAGLQCNKDSISGFMPKNRLSRVNLVNAEYIAFPIMIGALFVESDKDEFSILRKDYLPKFQSQLDNYSQFLPAAVMLGLKLGGVKGQSSWGECLPPMLFP